MQTVVKKTWSDIAPQGGLLYSLNNHGDKVIVGCDGDHGMREFDMTDDKWQEKKTMISMQDDEAVIGEAHVSPDGKFLIMSDETISLVEIWTLNPRALHTTVSTSFLCTAAGREFWGGVNSNFNLEFYSYDGNMLPETKPLYLRPLFTSTENGMPHVDMEITQEGVWLWCRFAMRVVLVDAERKEVKFSAFLHLNRFIAGFCVLKHYFVLLYFLGSFSETPAALRVALFQRDGTYECDFLLQSEVKSHNGFDLVSLQGNGNFLCRDGDKVTSVKVRQKPTLAFLAGMKQKRGLMFTAMMRSRIFDPNAFRETLTLASLFYDLSPAVK